MKVYRRLTEQERQKIIAGFGAQCKQTIQAKGQTWFCQELKGHDGPHRYDDEART